MKRLLLLRHGEAEPATPAIRDFDRVLTPHGRDQSREAAERLHLARCIPDGMRVSPALRARATATLVAERLACQQALVLEPLIYPGDLDALLEVVSHASMQIETLLLVGHNPGLSVLARRFAARSAAAAGESELPELRTAGLCRIELATDDWPQIEAVPVSSIAVLR